MTLDEPLGEPLDVRTIGPDDIGNWIRAQNTGFLRPPLASAERVEYVKGFADLDRTQGVFDQGRCVATFRSFPQELTVVGGAKVPSDAVTNVSVSPTHRRRGLLSRLMAKDLGEARERGDVVASLIAAEAPIYGRYGFGRASSTSVWEIDVPRSGLDPRWARPEGGGRIDLVEAADVRKAGPELFERIRGVQHGVVDRDERWWRVATGETVPPGDTWKEPFSVVYRSAVGEVEGLLVYSADDKWDDTKRPVNTATVRELIAATPAAERALWHYLCSVDWITKVNTGWRAPDDLVPDFLPDQRAASVVTHADWMWVRILDVEAALSARTYETSGTLVLEVRDASGLGGAGRYRLRAEGGAGTCSVTTEPADVELDIADLASLWMAEVTAARLTALGRLTERREGAAAAGDSLFRAARRPWCPDVF